MQELKQVYKAVSKQMAEQKLGELEVAWGKKYPLVIKSWRANWEELSAFFKYPEEIRWIIYTTNVITDRYGKLRRPRGPFPTRTR